MDSDATPVVTDQPDESRYELRVGGELAGFLVYRLRGQRINLIHTEVDPRFEGKGLAARLARFSLDDARKRNLTVVPTCPYVRSWIGRHPEYADLTATHDTDTHNTGTHNTGTHNTGTHNTGEEAT